MDKLSNANKEELENVAGGGCGDPDPKKPTKKTVWYVKCTHCKGRGSHDCNTKEEAEQIKNRLHSDVHKFVVQSKEVIIK